MECEKLNLGCGKDYREDWVNLDLGEYNYLGESIKVDVKHDLNEYPFPFNDNEFSEVVLLEVLEHIVNIDKFLCEMNRIMKDGGEMEIKVSYFAYYGTYAEFALHRFCLNHSQLFVFFKKNGFKLISKRVRNRRKILRIFDFFININDFTQWTYERFFSNLFPVTHVVWRIIKNKK